MNEYYFVYYDKGRCEEGDHDNDLIECLSLEEAYAKIEEIRGRAYDANIVLIKGTRKDIPAVIAVVPE